MILLSIGGFAVFVILQKRETSIGLLDSIKLLISKISKKPILKGKHIITIIQLILFVSGLLLIFGIAGQDPSIETGLGEGLTVGTLMVILVIILQVAFFLSSFLYLSVQSTGEYRRNSLLVFVGYLGQFIVNTISLISVQGNPALTVDEKFNLAGIFLLIRVIPMIIMAYGFLKLYGKKE